MSSKFRDKDYYSGQIIIIVLIVIIVGVIIGLAVLSRTIGDQQRTGLERNSAKALEIADTVLDLTKGVSYSGVVTIPECSTQFEQTGKCQVQGVSEVQEAFGQLGLSTTVLEENSCNADDFSLNLAFEKVDGVKDFELPKDNVWSYVLDHPGGGENINQGKDGGSDSLGDTELGTSEDLGGSTGLSGSGGEGRAGGTGQLCSSLVLNFANPASNSAVSISKFYANQEADGDAAQYKAYDPTDISGYCLGNQCNVDNGSNWPGNWVKNAGNSITVSLADSGGFKVDEVRVRAIGANLQFTTQLLPAGCTNIGAQSLKIVSGVTCAGTFRAKEVQVPLSSYSPALFDYVVFNSTGTLESGN